MGSTIQCSCCHHDNAADARSCAQCGAALRPVDRERVRIQLKRWQEHLLDLTKANPLLGINRSRVSKLRITEPAPHALFEGIVLADDAALSLPRVLKKPRSANDDGEEADYRVEPGDVAFDALPADLYRRLRRIYDNARTTVEERGVTTLHLTFGVLRWDDAVFGTSLSPLWLVPSALKSHGPNAPLRLTRADDEMQLNPALALYLRERHRIDLPELPDEPSAKSLASFLESVQAAVREVDWKVEPEVWLSTYSFESLVIYQDLKALADVAVSNEVVTALARAAAPMEGSEALGEEVLDDLPTPDRIPVPVLPTDSSQLAALTTARSGRHVVVHGPPGTGKSQTIANLIADALAQRKTVLFVSAKMAALDVVHDRLVKLGVDQFCLEAHSTKAGKLKIVEDLRRTLQAAQDARDSVDNNSLEDLLRVRGELNAYVRALHDRREPLGLSIYQACGCAERLRHAAVVRGELPWEDPLQTPRSQLKTVLEALGGLAAQAEVFDRRATHPWRGLNVQPSAPPRRDLIETDLLGVRDALDALSVHLPIVGRLWSVATEPLTVAILQALAGVLRELVTLDRLPEGWASRLAGELLGTAEVLAGAAKRAGEATAARAEHDRVLTADPEHTLRLLGRIEVDFGGWTRVWFRSYWRWRRDVRSALVPGASTSIAAIRTNLVRARRIKELDEWFLAHEASLSAEVGPSETRNETTVAAAAQRLRIAGRLRQAIEAAGLTPVPDSACALQDDLKASATALADIVLSEPFGAALRHLDEAWSAGFVDGVPALRAPIEALRARCAELLDALPKLHEWIASAYALNRCPQLGLGAFIEALGGLSARCLQEAFERRFYTSWAEAAMNQSPALVTFSGAQRDSLVTRYRALDEAARRAALAHVVAVATSPARRVAAASGVAGEAGQVGALRREMEKRRRIKPLRKLFAEVPAVLQALKPCFLMSPLSVSTFLKPGALRFDVVVFDEASQLPTPQAIPAVLRANHVVVAGDRNQLPPTSFFGSSVILDDDGDDAARGDAFQPLESLLDDCVAIAPTFEQAYLRWHYRSRDEQLIKFSNHYFYRDRPLITFPSVATDSEDQGVSLVHVPDGVWDRGGSRTNRTEARRVAALVIGQLSGHPERSLGVVAMNVTQREAIEEELEALLASHPHLAPLLEPQRAEPFFIKALENVQGDERDTMIISVGYGRSADGALTYNFGPLNLEGGWRRLNVLVTRARWHTILVTSLRSHDLDGVNPENRGAVALRNFIAYAERRGVLPAEAAVVVDAETNDFEDAVADALRERGYQVDAQVGASAYRIDLAIRDPKDPRRYLLGIECDGATYHSSPTARDRDLLRQEVLREQGWRLYRVWAPEWFHDRDTALTKLLLAVEHARKSVLERPLAATPSRVGAAPDIVRAPTPPVATPTTSGTPVPRRFPGGQPYRKYRGTGRRELLMDGDRIGELSDQIADVVRAEGPIHREVLLERLKELNGIDRAGTNVARNVERAIAVTARRQRLEMIGALLRCPGVSLSTYRTPGEGVERFLIQIPAEEIALAVLHKVEDQFGYQREALPRAVSELLGFDRLPSGGAEIIGTVVDDLVARGRLIANGPYVSLP